MLTAVERCLRSGNPLSQACQDASVNRLREECRRPVNRDNPVCRALAGPGGGGGGGGGGPTIPPLPLPGRGAGSGTGLAGALSEVLGSGRSSPCYSGLFGFGGCT